MDIFVVLFQDKPYYRKPANAHVSKKATSQEDQCAAILYKKI